MEPVKDRRIAIATAGAGFSLPAILLAAGLASPPMNLPDATEYGPSSTATRLAAARTTGVGGMTGAYPHPRAAFDALAVWCGVPTAENPCVIRIGPGRYDLAATGLEMRPFVHIVGAGSAATVLTGTGSTDPTRATVRGADHAILARLTVENTGASVYAVAIGNHSASPTIESVAARATGAYRSNVGIFNTRSGATLRYVTAEASGSGADNYGIRNEDAVFVSMSHTSAVARGGSHSNRGVLNRSQAHPRMRHVTARAEDGPRCIGVDNRDRSSPTLVDVTAVVSGCPDRAWAAHVGGVSSPTIRNSTLEVRGTALSARGLVIASDSAGTRITDTRIIGGVDDGAPETTNCRNTRDALLAEVAC